MQADTDTSASIDMQNQQDEYIRFLAENIKPEPRFGLTSDKITEKLGVIIKCVLKLLHPLALI